LVLVVVVALDLVHFKHKVLPEAVVHFRAYPQQAVDSVVLQDRAEAQGRVQAAAAVLVVVQATAEPLVQEIPLVQHLVRATMVAVVLVQETLVLVVVEVLVLLVLTEPLPPVVMAG
jgi:hypothetical protein